MSIRSAVKSLLLPKGVAARRIPFGVAAGVVMEIDFSFQARIFFGLYEREIANHLRALVRPGMRCFDIGSGVGYYSLALARRCGTEVVAVDTSPSVAEQLRRNVAANDLPVTVVEGRVGGGGTGDPLTIDRLAETYFRPDFIKMDIEGAETSALRGATNVLAGHAPSLVIEVHGSDIEAEFRALLEAQGYTPFAVAPRSWLAEERPAEYNGWLICPSPNSVQKT